MKTETKGIGHANTENLSAVSIIQEMLKIACKLSAARTKQGRTPDRFQREHGSANNLISDFYLLEL